MFCMFYFSESRLGDEDQPLLILDQARLQGRQFCAFAFQRKDSQNAWPLQMGIGECFVRKRALVQYQSQSEVIKVML